MARQPGAGVECILVEEVTYGTSPTSGYTKFPFSRNGLNHQQPLVPSDLMGRDPSAPIKDAVMVGGDIEVPLDLRSVGRWLKGAFGAPVTSGAGPYTHSFRSGGTSLPSLSVQTGYPAVPHFELFKGVMVDELSLSMQSKGLASMTAKLIGKTMEKRTTTRDNSAAAEPAMVRFGNWQGSARIDGTQIGNVVSASLRYANGLDPMEGISGNGEIEGAEPSQAAAEGSLVMRFADTVMLQKAIDGTPCELDLRFDLSPYLLSWKFHAIYLPKPKIETPGPKGVQATFDWQAAKDATLGRAVTVTLVNDVAAY